MGIPAIGDFIAIGKLAWDLYHKCYLVAKDAPKEFRELIDELGALHKAIERLERDAQNPESQLSKAGPDRLDTLVQVVNGTRGTLGDLQKLVDKYHKRLMAEKGKGLRAGGNAFWGRLKWSIEKGTVVDFQSRLLRDTARINLMMTAIGNSSLERLENMVERLLHAGRSEETATVQAIDSTSDTQNKALAEARTQIEDDLTEMHTRQQEAQSPPASSAEYWEVVKNEATDSDEEQVAGPHSILLVDCFLREHLVPMEACQTWAHIDRYILDLMRDESLFESIQAGQYSLYGPKRSPLSPETWQENIKPGWKVTMALKPLKKLTGHKLVPTFAEIPQSPQRHNASTGSSWRLSRSDSDSSIVKETASRFQDLYTFNRRDSDATLVEQDHSVPVQARLLSGSLKPSLSDITNGKAKLSPTSYNSTYTLQTISAPSLNPPPDKLKTADVTKYKSEIGFEFFCAKKLPSNILEKPLTEALEDKLFKLWSRAPKAEKKIYETLSEARRAPKGRYIATTGSGTDIRMFYQKHDGTLLQKSFSDAIELFSIFDEPQEVPFSRTILKKDTPIAVVSTLNHDSSRNLYLFAIDTHNRIRMFTSNGMYPGDWQLAEDILDSVSPESDIEAVIFAEYICVFYQSTAGRIMCRAIPFPELQSAKGIQQRLSNAKEAEPIVPSDKCMAGTCLSAITLEGLDGLDRRKRIILYYEGADSRIRARSLTPADIKDGSGMSSIKVGIIKEKTSKEENILSPPMAGITPGDSFSVCICGDLTIRILFIGVDMYKFRHIRAWCRAPRASWICGDVTRNKLSVYKTSHLHSMAWEDHARVWYQLEPNSISEWALDHGTWTDGGTVELFGDGEEQGKMPEKEVSIYEQTMAAQTRWGNETLRLAG